MNATCRHYKSKKRIQKTVCGYDDINIYYKNDREVVSTKQHHKENIINWIINTAGVNQSFSNLTNDF